MDKSGATDWTVGKLLTIILAVVLLALIIYGVSTGGINPLKERIIGMWDNVLGMFDGGDDGDGKIIEKKASIRGVGEGVLTVDKEECKIDLDGGNGSYRYNFKSKNLEEYVSVYEVWADGFALGYKKFICLNFDTSLKRWRFIQSHCDKEDIQENEWRDVNSYEELDLVDIIRIEILPFMKDKDIESGLGLLNHKKNEGRIILEISKDWYFINNVVKDYKETEKKMLIKDFLIDKCGR